MADETDVSLLADSPAVEKLLQGYDTDAYYGRSASDLLETQLAAVAERLTEQREHIPVLDRRATDVGVDEPTSLEDVCALLFSHQTYKSYPESFVAKGEWDRMNKWLGTVARRSPVGVDVSGVRDVDEWLTTLADHGYPAYATSGTTGKAGFLPYIPQDRQRIALLLRTCRSWVLGEAAQRTYPSFFLSPAAGPRVYVESSRMFAADLGRPGAVYFLSERPDSVAEINRLGAIRKAMGDGTIRAGELQQSERDRELRQAEMNDNLRLMADRLKQHRGEPILLSGAWASLLQLIDVLKEQGVKPGDFPDGSLVSGGGGRKMVALPDDYEERVREFFPGNTMRSFYGMSELVHAMPQCTEGRYHVPAGVLFLLLDETGEKVLNQESGRATGRAAFFDFALVGRWGGTITSDWLEVDFSPCPCGLAGTSILSVDRIAGVDDKLTCAGSIAAYIRGFVEG